MLDRDACYQALRAKDARFDGRLFVGITSTGIYCRPICPARAAKREHCVFFASAAAAQQGGFRPCLRCRPEKAPESAVWLGTSSTVSRGLALIAAGELDAEGATVETLAERLGVGGRQLRRLFLQHLGASPVAVAQARRVHFAKQLIQDTRLPMAEIALASGFGSLRRYNETFRALFDRPPSALRRKRGAPEPASAAAGVTVRLSYRAPYDWTSMLAHLEGRAVGGIERVEGGVYVRTTEHDGEVGTVEVRHDAAGHALAVTVRFGSVRALPAMVARVRHAFDLGVDVQAVEAHLRADPMLAPLVAARPGLRVPGGWDGFELAVRAVLGQQVSVAAARTLAGRLARLCAGGGPLAFPTPARVLRADLSSLGVPGARREALLALARAAEEDPALFEPKGDLAGTVARLRRVPGVGEWTAHYIAMRAAREPDALPASDLGLLRAAEGLEPGRWTPAALARRSAAWSPWRAYAVQHLYAHGANPLARPRRTR